MADIILKRGRAYFARFENAIAYSKINVGIVKIVLWSQSPQALAMKMLSSDRKTNNYLKLERIVLNIEGIKANIKSIIVHKYDNIFY